MNRKNYAPRSFRRCVRCHNQLVGDRSVVLYRLSDNPTISCPILEGLLSRDQKTHDLGTSENARAKIKLRKGSKQ